MNPYEQLAIEVARQHGVNPREVIGRSRLRMHVWPRQEAMWKLYLRSATASYPIIGRWAGRDHSTVVQAVQRHQARYEAEHHRRHA